MSFPRAENMSVKYADISVKYADISVKYANISAKCDDFQLCTTGFETTYYETPVNPTTVYLYSSVPFPPPSLRVRVQYGVTGQIIHDHCFVFGKVV